jgi:hypothetical protein
MTDKNSTTVEESNVCRLANGKVSYRVGVSEDRNKRCRRVMEVSL